MAAEYFSFLALAVSMQPHDLHEVIAER